MKKTMYIPRGQEKCFNSLTCENIVVNGSLKVEGEIRAKHIRGKGFVYANVISAESMTANTIDAGMVIVDRLLAERVAAVEIHAAQNMAVSCYLEAELVKAGRIAMADATISELISDEVIYLKPKRRGLLGTLFASYVRAKWTALFYRKPTGSVRKPQGPVTPPAEAEPVSPTADMAEMVELLNDPEFLHVRTLYYLSKQMDCVVQFVPREAITGEFTSKLEPELSLLPFDEEDAA